MSKVFRINTSNIEGVGSNENNSGRVLSKGEAGFYDNNFGKLELVVGDGVNTHLKNKILGKGVFYGGNADSGDGYGFDTIKLIPDATLHFDNANYNNHQYLIIDPTYPNHIHIRAGGAQDASTAELFLGGENTNVKVSDDDDSVTIKTLDVRGEIPAGREWVFDNTGKLTLPGEAYANTPSSIYNSNYEIRLYPTYNGVTGLGPELSVHYDDALVITANTNDFSTSSGTRATSLKLLGATATGAMESGRVWIDSGYQPDGGPKGAVNIGTVEATAINIGNSGSTLTISGNTNAALKTTGQWAVPIGTNTYSFEVPLNGTYSMWVRANIPNGIIAWNATLTVTNNNVPAIGQQFAWNYNGAGTPIALTALPNQIEGTAGTISTTNTYVGSTANTFTFGISNTSGASQIVYWGYTKI